jgi:hypothetical protein
MHLFEARTVSFSVEEVEEEFSNITNTVGRE